MKRFDYLVIGAGIVGITISLELKKRHPKARVLLLEKELDVGMHSSGRNSGVIHSGIYYPPGSIKAEVCKKGSVEMKEFHYQHNLRINECGKILTVSNKQNKDQLDLLANRAKEHGICVDILDEHQLKEIEPMARSAIGQALFVADTAVGDPAAVMRVLRDQAKDCGIELLYGVCVESVNVTDSRVKLSSGESVLFGHAINTAGLFADQVAHKFGVGLDYTMMPFKGIYWKLKPGSDIALNHLIYPVPDLSVPFLGVHTTTTVDGSVYFGPTAVPAWGRENYAGLEGFNFKDASSMLSLLSKQIIRNKSGFRRLAWQEGRKSFKYWFVEAAQSIVPSVRSSHLMPTSKVGIRPQLFDTNKQELVNDFLIKSSPNSTHILNAISPAWTSAFAFARHVCNHHVI